MPVITIGSSPDYLTSRLGTSWCIMIINVHIDVTQIGTLGVFMPKSSVHTLPIIDWTWVRTDKE